MNNPRLELKFIINLIQKKMITEQLRSQGFSSKTYFVSSEYLDTIDFKSYREKVEGENNKKKYRFRTYDNELETRHFHVKQKIGHLGEKIKHSDQDCMLDSYKGQLVPICKINYERTEFVRGELRLTLDEKIQYVREKHIIYTDLGLNILEYKAGMITPWFKHFMLLHKISPVSFSKYTSAVEKIYGHIS